MPHAADSIVEFLDPAGAVISDHRFEVKVTEVPAPSGTSPSGEARITLDVAYGGDAPLAAAIRFRLLLADAPDPWWLIPGAFYGENRPAACDRIFPRFEVGGNDPEGMVSDRWEFRADRCATPAVFAWGGRGGVALVAEERSALGMVGVGFAHDAATSVASVHLTFPYREGPITYYGSGVPLPAEVTTHDWQPGERASLSFIGYELGTDRHEYAAILRQAHARQAESSPVEPWLGVVEAADVAAEGLLRWHYDPDPGVLLETVGFDRELSGRDGKSVDRQAMHVGWVSGIPWAYALLAPRPKPMPRRR